MNDKLSRRVGWGLTGIFAVFMVAASITPKFVGAEVATVTLTQLGWPASSVVMIGLIELAFLILYLLPGTSLFGAVLMTGLLGGAMAAQIRVGNPLFSHILFSMYLALFMWGGLWLRDPALRAMFPLRTR